MGGRQHRSGFFEYAFSSKRFPPDGANRGHYRNARIDALTDQIRVEMNQEKRKALCSEVQKILPDDLPYLPLWFNDVVSVHRRSLGAVDLPSTGNYNFLATLRRLESSRRILSRVAWSKSVLFQRLRDLCHGDGPFAADSPGVAI